MLKRLLALLHPQPQNESPSLLSNANLYEPEDTPYKNLEDKYALSFIKFLMSLIAFICFSFLCLLAYNSYLDSQLFTLKQETDTLSSQLLQYENNITFARQVDKKIAVYKKVMSERGFIGETIDFLTKDIGDVKILRIHLGAEKFELETTGPTPLSFVNLLNKYLSSEKISQIIIREARLNINDNTYEVSLEGKF